MMFLRIMLTNIFQLQNEFNDNILGSYAQVIISYADFNLQTLNAENKEEIPTQKSPIHWVTPSIQTLSHLPYSSDDAVDQLPVQVGFP